MKWVQEIMGNIFFSSFVEAGLMCPVLKANMKEVVKPLCVTFRIQTALLMANTYSLNSVKPHSHINIE